MSVMKARILSVWTLVMLLSVAAFAQEPRVTYDGKKLQIVVTTGYLEFYRPDIDNTAISNSINWDADDHGFFMAQTDPYVYTVEGLSTDETVTLKGTFNNEPIILNVEMISAPQQPDSVDPIPPSSGLDIKMMAIIGGVVVLLLVLVFVLTRKKRKPVDDPKAVNDPSIISVVTDESVKYEKGLQHVKQRLNEYLVFDMDMVFADTAVNKVYFSTLLIKKLYDFFNSSLEAGGRTNETGCFILGCWDFEEGSTHRYDVSLEYMVEPGDDADFGEYSLNFGKKISVNMASVIDNLAQKSNRDYLLTCWMHSHPGLGLFLSNQDLVVQRQLTYPDHKNRLIAIVIDTNTPDFKVGFFTAKADGSMNNKEEVKRWFSFEEIYRQSRELSRGQTPMEDLQKEFVAKPDFFTIALKDEAIAHLGFAAHSINQIDNALYSNTKGLNGYFYGEMEDSYLQVSCLLPYENEEKLGCLLFGDNMTEAQLAQYANDIAGCRFVVNATTDDKLIVWIKNDNGGYAPVGETTLTQMKEWIRRKRV